MRGSQGCMPAVHSPPSCDPCLPLSPHSGVDGLAQDPVAAAWGLTPAVYAAAATEVAGWGAPLLLLGGGGYDSPAAAAAWAGVVAALLGRQLPDEVPEHDHLHRYGPGFTLSSGAVLLRGAFCWRCQMQAAAVCQEVSCLGRCNTPRPPSPLRQPRSGSCHKTPATQLQCWTPAARWWRGCEPPPARAAPLLPHPVCLGKRRLGPRCGPSASWQPVRDGGCCVP